jgi:hypothetical protein
MAPGQVLPVRQHLATQPVGALAVCAPNPRGAVGP